MLLGLVNVMIPMFVMSLGEWKQFALPRLAAPLGKLSLGLDTSRTHCSEALPSIQGSFITQMLKYNDCFS